MDRGRLGDARRGPFFHVLLGLGIVVWWVSCWALLVPTSAQAQGSVSRRGGEFGLGLIIGDPTGISGKYFLSQELAIDGALGFGFIGGRHTKLQSDLLWHFGVQRWPAAGLDLYVGVGPTLAFHDHHHHNDDHHNNELWIGVRGPFGAALSFNNAPFDVFLEIAAELWLVQHANLDLDAALGVRYWF